VHDKTRTLEPVESEAQIVRLVFAWYVHGDPEGRPLSITGITKRLNKLGVAPYSKRREYRRRGTRGLWTRGVVHKMLGNSVYAGRWYYGKRRHGETGKLEPNPREYWLEVDVPAIVAEDVWQAAQERLEKNRRRWAPRKHDYLLSGRATCGFCGKSMVGKSAKGGAYLYYYCSVRSKSGRYGYTCDLPAFRADQVDPEVWRWVRGLLSDPWSLAQGINDYRAAQAEQHVPLQEELQVIGEQLTEERAKRKRCIELYIEGQISKAERTAHLVQLEANITRLVRRQETLKAALQGQSVTEAQIADLQEFAVQLSSRMLSADQSFEAKRRVLDLLNVQAELVVRD